MPHLTFDARLEAMPVFSRRLQSETRDLTSVPISVTYVTTSLIEGAFPEGMPEKRSGGGACGRICHPLPGGSGPPLDRHDDRSPRSSVNSRQIEAGNAREVRSQETRELELSQRRMRSPWRVPQQSAGRRARPELARCRPERDARAKCALVCMAAMVRMRLSALRSLFCCRGRVYFRNGVVVVGKARTHKRAARTILVVCANINSFTSPLAGEVAPKARVRGFAAILSQAEAPPHPDLLPARGEKECDRVARINLSVPAQMPSPLPTGESSARLSVPGEGRPSLRPLSCQGRRRRPRHPLPKGARNS